MFRLTIEQLAEFVEVAQDMGERAVIVITQDRIEAYMGPGEGGPRLPPWVREM